MGSRRASMPSNETLTSPEAASTVGFEVERFEWTSSDRLEVAGRWFGLRGHRFMRPALFVEAGDERRRLLALLEHKPWAAEEGEPWMAAFSWPGDPVDLAAAELAVAPNVAVELPPVRAPRARGRGGGPRPAASGRGRTPAAPPGGPPPPPPGRR